MRRRKIHSVQIVYPNAETFACHGKYLILVNKWLTTNAYSLAASMHPNIPTEGG